MCGVLMMLAACPKNSPKARTGDGSTIVQCSGPDCVIHVPGPTALPETRSAPTEALTTAPPAEDDGGDDVPKIPPRTCPSAIEFRDANDHLAIRRSCAAAAAAGQYRLHFHNGRKSQYRFIVDRTRSVQLRLAPGEDVAIDVATGADETHVFSASYESAAGVYRMPNGDTTWTVERVSDGDEVFVDWDCSASQQTCP